MLIDFIDGPASSGGVREHAAMSGKPQSDVPAARVREHPSASGRLCDTLRTVFIMVKIVDRMSRGRPQMAELEWIFEFPGPARRPQACAKDLCL
jgi:hypothetical protein